MKHFPIYILIISIMFLGCRKDEIEGPELQDIFGDFEILEGLTASRDTVNFAIGETVDFNARLTIRTDWELRVVGLESGAVKVIEGREREIDGTTTNWNGTITFAPLFGNENCATFLTFKNHPDTLVGDTVFVSDIKPESLIDVLVSDFTTGTGWGSFAEAAAVNQQLVGNYFVQDPLSSSPSFIEVGAPEGTGHWRMTHNNISNIFICGANIASSAVAAPTGDYLEFGTTNPDNVYINMLVHGFGDGNTRLSIGMQEDDNLDGTYDRFAEGTYNTEILVDWQGWKVVSIPLSSFNLSTVGGFGNIDGTGQQDIDRILSMEFLLLASEGSTGFVGFGLDYINFTRYSAWNP